ITDVTQPVTKGGLAYLEGTLNDAPDSAAAFDTVDRVHAAVHAVPGADAQVGGGSAVNLDIQRASAHDRNVIIPILLGVVFVILDIGRWIWWPSALVRHRDAEPVTSAKGEPALVD